MDGVCICRTGKAGEISDLLAALANEQRLMVVALLREVGEMSVGDMASNLGVNRAALSRHLARLRDLSLVTTHRRGNRVFYALDHEHAPRLLHVVDILMNSGK